MTQLLDRRQLVQLAGLTPVALLATPVSLFSADNANSTRKKLPVAAVVTVYTRNSHADVLVGKILEGYRQDGGPGPDLELVSLYTDQVPKNDLSRDLAKKHGFRICKTIDEAVTLGTDKVQVAGVLSIGEHGSYPYTKDTKQHMYPRRRFFDEITAAMKRGGKTVPLFNDKHLAYNWRDAKHMYDTAKKMKLPMMAGSSLPTTWRRPPLQLPKDCEIEAALTVGYGGFESYGFHALETHQCMVEQRRGGEAGVKSIEAAQGNAIDKAEKDGRWSQELLNAVLEVLPKERLRGKGRKENGKWEIPEKAAMYLLEHRDGLKSAVAMLNGLVADFAIAVKLRNQPKPLATWFKLEEERPYGHFEHLLRAIEPMLRTGKPSYPVERTLLTTGVLDTVMSSLAQGGKRLATPHLDIKYRSSRWTFANAGELAE